MLQADDILPFLKGGAIYWARVNTFPLTLRGTYVISHEPAFSIVKTLAASKGIILLC